MTKKIFGKAKMNVAGTTFENRQGKLHTLRKAESAYLTLRRQPKNEKDENAVQVIAHTVSKNGKKSVFAIGYIPTNKAVWLAPAMDAGKICRVTSFKVIGGGKTNLGCEITISHELYETELVPAEADEQ